MQTVFHLIQGDPEDRKTALTIAENLTQDETVEMDAIEVVAQADGIEPLTADGEGSDHVRSLLDDGVAFKACGNTLDMEDLDEADLVDGVETVPSGAGELTRLQDEGYSYIRP
ncbi:MAG TPA: DsrE family protein [Natronoarchaeum rubrum]|nr:DsrE family protein [Natronoarchaeum rubrum]